VTQTAGRAPVLGFLHTAGGGHFYKLVTCHFLNRRTTAGLAPRARVAWLWSVAIRLGDLASSE
jgi:hypothetical protein